VLADGTYATQSAVEVAAPSAASALGSPNTPNLRTLLLVSQEVDRGSHHSDGNHPQRVNQQ
jgi:hypothetical protein